MSTSFSNSDGTGIILADGFQNSGDITLTTSQTLTADDSGKVIFVATDALVVTLPAVSAGLNYKFVNTGADGNNIITISPNASDAIHGTITLAATVVELGGIDDKDLINTKVTAKTGNSVSLVSDGTNWYIIASTGIWASQV